jgi:hypothetical protein
MISNISSLQGVNPYQSTPSTQYSSPLETSPPVPMLEFLQFQDSITLSPAGLAALQNPGEISSEAGAGDPSAISTSEMSQNPGANGEGLMRTLTAGDLSS